MLLHPVSAVGLVALLVAAGGCAPDATAARETSGPAPPETSVAAEETYDDELDPVVCSLYARDIATQEELGRGSLRMTRLDPQGEIRVGSFVLYGHARWSHGEEGGPTEGAGLDPTAFLSPLRLSVDFDDHRVWETAMWMGGDDGPPDFTDGHGFTGLMRFYDSAGAQELQVWCEAG